MVVHILNPNDLNPEASQFLLSSMASLMYTVSSIERDIVKKQNTRHQQTLPLPKQKQQNASFRQIKLLD